MVDIVIPSYNRGEFLKKAIQSVQNQTFKDWKLWVVDDGSTDGSFDTVVKTFSSSNFPMEFLDIKKNRGVSFARNQGIVRGQAEWVAFLDSDDEWLPDKLEKQLQFAREKPELPLIHCNEVWFRNGKPFPQKKKHKKQGGRIFVPSTRLCCVSPSAALLRRSLLEKLGLFREDFPVCEDYEMWLRVTSRYSVGFVEEALVIKRGGHGDQLSRRYPAMDYWRIKALTPYLKDKNLSQEERDQVKEVIMEKGRILLKGYEKHQNFKNKREVENILRMAADYDLSVIKK